ncbi:MAG: hypothetical protein ACTSYS_13830 [Promethearchaeota archaeon]
MMQTNRVDLKKTENRINSMHHVMPVKIPPFLSKLMPGLIRIEVHYLQDPLTGRVLLEADMLLTKCQSCNEDHVITWFMRHGEQGMSFKNEIDILAPRQCFYCKLKGEGVQIEVLKTRTETMPLE